MIKTAEYGNIREYLTAGVFGDMEVRISTSSPAFSNGVDVLLLHGVHSSANMGEHNKFRYLADILSDRGFTPWLVETSRIIRNRQDFSGDVSQWIKGAFTGKTFAQEERDVFNAIRGIRSISEGCSFWLWGFSLGGIIALSAAAFAEEKKPERIILSGTGIRAYEETEERMMSLPILSTLRSDMRPEMLSNVRTEYVVSFRGTKDDIFSEESCKEVLKEIHIPEDKKYFRSVQGADHSFRSRYGKADPSIMNEMVDCLTEI